MNELIWFSVPGAITLFALLLAMPGNFSDLTSDNAAIIIVAAPILGFIIHQLWRTIFEVFYGYNSQKRPVIRKLMNKYNLNNVKAFLLWELTLYSNDMPESFREHDRRAWHYIMSFCSCALAGILGAALIIICDSNKVGWTCIFLTVSLMFIAKVITTRNSLNRQEVAVLDIYPDTFDEFAQKV